MRAARKTAEEQYQMVLECRRSGLTDCDWCRENGVNLETFYTWIRRLKKKGGFSVPPASKQQVPSTPSHDIARIDILPDEEPHGQFADKNTFNSPMVQSRNSSIEIEVHGATFRFSGPVDPALYEKTLLMIGGRL